ncbi:MAG: hypothetical protein ACRDUV_06960 [Pseudonocardiaceae bacterium]
MTTSWLAGVTVTKVPPWPVRRSWLYQPSGVACSPMTRRPAHCRPRWSRARFHRRVQTAFRTGLMGADAAPERVLTLVTGRAGRVDLFVIPRLGERMAVVIEIKNTDWDALDEHRVRPNIRRHIRQLQNSFGARPFAASTGTVHTAANLH